MQAAPRGFRPLLSFPHKRQSSTAEDKCGGSLDPRLCGNDNEVASCKEAPTALLSQRNFGRACYRAKRITFAAGERPHARQRGSMPTWAECPATVSPNGPGRRWF